MTTDSIEQSAIETAIRILGEGKPEGDGPDRPEGRRRIWISETLARNLSLAMKEEVAAITAQIHVNRSMLLRLLTILRTSVRNRDPLVVLVPKN